VELWETENGRLVGGACGKELLRGVEGRVQNTTELAQRDRKKIVAERGAPWGP